MHEPLNTEWLSVEQVADRVSVSVPTVRSWLARGELPGHRLGNRLIRIKASDLDALLTPLPASSEASR